MRIDERRGHRNFTVSMVLSFTGFPPFVRLRPTPFEMFVSALQLEQRAEDYRIASVFRSVIEKQRFMDK